MVKQVVIYSHGFGVKKDDRGLFTDIATSMPNAMHMMFDYNSFDFEKNTMIVAPLGLQAKSLRQQINAAKAMYPDATIDLVCHSQGCVVAALDGGADVQRAIFLAPPGHVSKRHMIEIFRQRLGIKFSKKGLTSIPRRDGSTTIVPIAYWLSIRNTKPLELYNRLVDRAEVTIINANQDEVLVASDFAKLSSAIEIIGIDGDHNFKGAARAALISQLQKLLV